MNFRVNLRVRVATAFALLGMVVSSGLGITYYYLTLEMENRLLGETLRSELDDYMARYAADKDASPPTSTRLQTYVFAAGSQRPELLRHMSHALDLIELDGKKFISLSRKVNGKIFMMLYDSRPIQLREQRYRWFLLLGVLSMSTVAALLGYWLAARVIAPVRDLSARVARMLLGEPKPALTEEFPDDELGVLAREFDAYQRRLYQFIERERAFTADISHELRTPLSIIEGAAEILLGDPELDSAKAARITSIRRSARQLAELVDALLLLAREQNRDQTVCGCDVGSLLTQIVEEYEPLLAQKNLTVETSVHETITLPVECALLRVVLANLIRNAIAFTTQGSIYIAVNAEGILVKDTGSGIAEQQLQKIFSRYYAGPSGGEGIGLSLVKRICQRFGWQIELESALGTGTRIHLSFSEADIESATPIKT